MVMNLALFPAGSETCINYIPSGLGGIYAWFRNYKYSEDPDALYEQILADCERPKFAERTGIISPYYHVGIRSYGKLSEGKAEKLKEALRNPDFRQHFHYAIGNSILFQSPLYVGKAFDLRTRIKQHLMPNSILRSRLGDIGIPIDDCILMVCPLWNSHNSLNEKLFGEDIEQDSEEEQDTADERPRSGYEDLFEEIFSRLFSPQFSIKLG